MPTTDRVNPLPSSPAAAAGGDALAPADSIEKIAQEMLVYSGPEYRASLIHWSGRLSAFVISAVSDFDGFRLLLRAARLEIEFLTSRLAARTDAASAAPAPAADLIAESERLSLAYGASSAIRPFLEWDALWSNHRALTDYIKQQGAR